MLTADIPSAVFLISIIVYFKNKSKSKEGIVMIQDAAQRIKENYDRFGDLTDEQFVAAKAKACSKRLIHAERISDVQLIDPFVGNRQITVSQIKPNTTIKIKATVRNMASQTEKTGFVTLEDIQDVQFDEKTGMLAIENDKYIVTTLRCEKEMGQLEAVLRGENWVDMYSLRKLISNDTLLSDFQIIRDGISERGRSEHDVELQDLEFVEDITTPDLLF
jgi:hypothetical protein